MKIEDVLKRREEAQPNPEHRRVTRDVCSQAVTDLDEVEKPHQTNWSAFFQEQPFSFSKRGSPDQFFDQTVQTYSRPSLMYCICVKMIIVINSIKWILKFDLH